MTHSPSKVWLITGSSRGLGRALAEEVLAAGHRVVATARALDSLAPLVERHGRQVLPLVLDVTSPEAAQAAVRAAVDSFGRIDVLVNNAGYAKIGSVEDLPLDDLRAQIDTNFYGVVYVTRAALPVLRAQRAGLVMQISSIGGRRGKTPGLSAYQASKFALEGFSESLASEVAPFGIRVVIVEPGGFATDMTGTLQAHPFHSDYEQTVGATVARFRSGESGSRGDARKAAKALRAVSEAADPPRRLLLGTDALFLAKVSEEERMREDATWRDLSASTDRDGLTDFAQTQMAKDLAKLTTAEVKRS